MKRASKFTVLLSLVALAGCAGDATAPQIVVPEARLSSVVASTAGVAVYNNIPSPLPGNVPSQGFQCCQAAEVGDHVSLAGTARRASGATVLMSSWALHSTYPTMSTAGYMHPITLNLYSVASGPALGALIGTITTSFLIPWRPEADASCPNGTAWRHSSGACFNGYAFTIDFDLRSLALTLPNEIIFGVAFNTNTWGYAPIGQPGPYESLNVGTANVGGVGVPPSVGVDVEPGFAFFNTKYGPFYSDGGAGGVGTFRRDGGWLGYSPAVQISAFSVATTADDCKNGGWQSSARADGSGFANQGDCVSYTRNGK